MARKPQATASPSPEPPAQSTTVHPTGSQQGTPNMSTFSDILDTPLDAIEAPKPIPVGSYIAVIDGNYETGESSKQKTPYVRFQFKVLQAMEADPAEVEASKAIGKKVRQDFYLTEDALFRLKRFLADTLDIQGANLKEALAQTPGKQLVVVMHHELTQPTDGSEPQVISRVKNTLKV